MKALGCALLCFAAAGYASSCSKAEEGAGKKVGGDEWDRIGYFSVFDPISEIHVKRTFQNLGIEWRVGETGWRGYWIEVRSFDRDRGFSALKEDDRLGNISFLDGVETPDLEPTPESIRRPASELLKSERFAEGTLEGRIFRIPEIEAALKDFPQVVWFTARRRSYLGEDDRRHLGLEGSIELAVDLHKEVAGKRMSFYLYRDGEVAQSRGGNEWWHGGEQSKEELWRRWRARPQ